MPVNEYESFAKLVASLEMAEAAAKELSLSRLDQPWRKVAENLDQMKQAIYRLVGDGQVRTRQ